MIYREINITLVRDMNKGPLYEASRYDNII